jgi:hypothetical protein
LGGAFEPLDECQVLRVREIGRVAVLLGGALMLSPAPVPAGEGGGQDGVEPRRRPLLTPPPPSPTRIRVYELTGNRPTAKSETKTTEAQGDA